MLTKMREGASSWPAKILLCVVALSFVGWGVGDIFVGRGETTVAEVGSSEIDVRDLQIAYQNRVRSLQASGFQVDPGSDMARYQAGLVLDRLVLDRLETEAAGDFGVTIGDDTLRSDIAGNEAFFDADGSFDTAVFAGVLATNGLTEATYLGLLGEQIVKDQFVGSISAVPPPPRILVDSVFRHREEQRTAEYAVIPDSTLVAVAPEPEAGELEAYFEERASSYSAPEYRSATYLLVYPEDLAGGIEVADEAVRTAYDTNPDDWRDPEQRLLLQMSFETEEEAATAHETVRDGADFEQVAAEAAGLEAEEIAAQWFVKSDLFPELADPVFSADVGGIVGPLASPLGGWLVYRVEESTPEQVTPFEQAREEIASELRLRRARNAMFGLANDMDDLLAAGATVRETANALGLEAGTLERVSAFGDSEDPLSLQVIPSASGFLEELFLGELDFPSTVIETDDGGLLAVEVTEIIPGRLRDLDEVRDKALADWQEARLGELAQDAARDIADTVTAAGDLDAAFSAAGAAFATTEPLVRTQQPGIDNVGMSTLEALFDAMPGDISVTESADGQARVVVRLQDIVPGDPTADSEAYDRIRESLAGGLSSDVTDLNSSAMRNAFDVSIDHDLVEQHF